MKRAWLIAGAALLGLLLAGTVWSQAEEPAPSAESSSSAELATGRWMGGGGIGVLGSTPDGAAIGMSVNADYFVNERVSVGPLLQVGGTDDMTLAGLSGQAKYWLPLSGTGGRGKVALQTGIGFAHADFRGDDTSWLIPMGIAYEHTLASGTTLNATTLLNFTNLHTGGGTGADVMPGLTFGVRF